MDKNPSAQRIEWVDFAKGLGIILMVLGHFIKFQSGLYNFIFVFHMPFFFIMTGFLLNLNKWGGDYSYKKFVSKLVKRLLLPYYLAEILWYPVWFIVCHEAGLLKYLWSWDKRNPLTSFIAIFIGNGNDFGLILSSLWFLPTLLIAEIIFIKLFHRLKKFDAEVFVLAVVCCSCIGLNLKFLVLPLGIDIALVSQIFLLVGILIRKYNTINQIDARLYILLGVVGKLKVNNDRSK